MSTFGEDSGRRSSSRYATASIEPDDVASGFSCGRHDLDDYFARHALANDRAGIGRASILRRAEGDSAALPRVLGSYTLSMANVEAAKVSGVLKQKLPKYPMPVALIGRLARDERAKGGGVGERLLADALRRVVDAAGILGCTGIIVDAKDDDAARFYSKYDFVTVAADARPHRMFPPIGTARAAFEQP